MVLKFSLFLGMLSTVMENQAIADYFADPFVAAADKLAALGEVEGLNETTVNLFGALAENNRLNILNEVAEVYARIIQADSGSVPCEERGLLLAMIHRFGPFLIEYFSQHLVVKLSF